MRSFSVILGSLVVFSSSVFAGVLLPRTNYGPTQEIFLRVEGPNATAYEETVYASGGYITTKSGGKILCDGGNFTNSSDSRAGPTPINALKASGLSFDLYPDGEFVTEIDGIENSDTGGWGSAVERLATGKEDCDVVLADKSHVEYVWINGGFDSGDVNYLVLSGPASVGVGSTATFSVVGTYGDGTPAPPVVGSIVNDKLSDLNGNTGATVHGTTGSNGKTTIKFSKKGTYNLKAHPPPPNNSTNGGEIPAIRSNHLVVTVS